MIKMQGERELNLVIHQKKAALLSNLWDSHPIFSSFTFGYNSIRGCASSSDGTLIGGIQLAPRISIFEGLVKGENTLTQLTCNYFRKFKLFRNRNLKVL